MSHNPRIQRKILQYSIIFKAIGILNEEEYNQIANSLDVKRQHEASE